MPENIINSLTGNFVGTLIMVATFLIPLFGRYFRQNPTVIIAAWLGIGARQVFTYYNTFIGPNFLTQNDAQFFYLAATRVTEHSYNKMLYTKALRVLFQIFGPSQFLGSETSILAYSGAILAIGCILGLFQASRKIGTYTILLAGILPGSIIFTAVTLRESWQMLFFSWGLYFISKITLKQNFASSYLGSLICFFLLAPLHNGLVPFFFFAALLPLIYFQLSRQALVFIAVAFIIPTSMLFDIEEVNIVGDSSSFDALQSGNAVAYIQKYQGNASEGRTAYEVPFLKNKGLSSILALPLTFIYYNIEPLPNHIQNPLDLYAAAENVLRLWLYWGIFQWWRSEPDEQKRHRYMLPIIYIIALESLWALGTSNWGTALRHHVPALPALLAFGFLARSWSSDLTNPQDSAEASTQLQEQREPLSKPQKKYREYSRTKPSTTSYREYRNRQKAQKDERNSKS